MRWNNTFVVRYVCDASRSLRLIVTYCETDFLHISFLRKSDSRSPLLVSRQAFNSLISGITSISLLLQLLPGFVAEEGHYLSGISSFSARTLLVADDTIFVTSYNIKHVELHGRQDTLIPWSIRETGIYQQFTIKAQSSDCVVIQSSRSVQKRFEEMGIGGNEKFAGLPLHWSHFHEIVLSTVTSNWQEYIKLLDKSINDIVGPSITYWTFQCYLSA